MSSNGIIPVSPSVCARAGPDETIREVTARRTRFPPGPEARIALTLRCVCGLATAEIAASFVIPEPTMAQRLVRAKRKIRQAGIRLKSPGQPDLPRRLAVVLRVVYLVFTQGHMAQAGPDLVRGTLCEQAIRLARALATLMPEEPEVMGLLALLLLADARREARTSAAGELVRTGRRDRRAAAAESALGALGPR